ncbi:MAG TPA: tryptophan synthase subunit alpha [Gemmatimonadales bacterium]|nr:tryptophan synthase subunit alpha [Gemmatimonadales bacterium]
MALSPAITSSDVALRGALGGPAAALVAYLTAGHPDRATSLEALRVAARWAEVIEVGVPFSDPLADGPVIQRASQRALDGGMTVRGALDLVAAAGLSCPVVLFSYLNPLLRYGLPRLMDDAAAAGVAGLLVTDLPAGSDPGLEAQLAAGPLTRIPLVAPTTSVERMRAVSRLGGGFVYLISRLGVTGARAGLPPDLSATVARVREATSLPVAVGFGVSTPEQAREAGQLADGVVVGSALVAALEARGVAGLEALLVQLHDALGTA